MLCSCVSHYCYYQVLRALTAKWGVTDGDAPLSRLELVGATSRRAVCVFCAQFFDPDTTSTTSTQRTATTSTATTATAATAVTSSSTTPFLDTRYETTGDAPGAALQEARALLLQQIRAVSSSCSDSAAGERCGSRSALRDALLRKQAAQAEREAAATRGEDAAVEAHMTRSSTASTL
jgi:hypothetical protein